VAAHDYVPGHRSAKLTDPEGNRVTLTGEARLSRRPRTMKLGAAE
jgi:hypothetical protein